jgi:hypothetical protein
MGSWFIIFFTSKVDPRSQNLKVPTSAMSADKCNLYRMEKRSYRHCLPVDARPTGMGDSTVCRLVGTNVCVLASLSYSLSWLTGSVVGEVYSPACVPTMHIPQLWTSNLSLAPANVSFSPTIVILCSTGFELDTQYHVHEPSSDVFMVSRWGCDMVGKSLVVLP